MSKSLSVTALKAKLKATQKASATRIAEATAKAILEATIALESSPALFASKVQLSVSSQNTDALQNLINQCEVIINDMPITNPKSRTTRVWAGSRRFAFGSQINLMYQLVTGILYSCAEHKQLLLAHTGLTGELLEQFAEAFGTPAYYSRNFNTLVEAKPYTIENVMSAVAVMQSELNVVVDTSQLTVANFSLEFGKGEVTAETNKLKADEAIAEADMQI